MRLAASKLPRLAVRVPVLVLAQVLEQVLEPELALERVLVPETGLGLGLGRVRHSQQQPNH